MLTSTMERNREGDVTCLSRVIRNAQEHKSSPEKKTLNSVWSGIKEDAFFVLSPDF